MGYKASNFAKSLLAVGLGGTSGDTTLQIQASDVSKFPVINDAGVGSDFTMIVLTDSAKNREIVKCTRHDTGSASFTIVRAQEGTTARIWQPGDSVSVRLTAGVVTQTYTHPSETSGAHAASAISVTPAGGVGSTNVQDALVELDTEKSSVGHTHSAGSIVVTPAGGIASTTVQGALQELDSEKLQASDIGSTVQAYDAATAKTNQDQQYTKPQRTTPLTDNDLSFDIGSGGAQDFVCTPTAGGTLTFTNIRAGAKGEILLVNNSNYVIAKAATVKCPASMLATISATGRYRLAYSSLDGTNVDITNSAALS